MSDDRKLPRLLDARGLQNELGVKRKGVEAILRELDVVELPGVRKRYVRHGDVVAFLQRCSERQLR